MVYVENKPLPTLKGYLKNLMNEKRITLTVLPAVEEAAEMPRPTAAPLGSVAAFFCKPNSPEDVVHVRVCVAVVATCVNGIGYAILLACCCTGS